MKDRLFPHDRLPKIQQALKDKGAVHDDDVRWLVEALIQAEQNAAPTSRELALIQILAEKETEIAQTRGY